MKTINGIQYNVDVIFQMTFEEFRSTCTGQTEEKIANAWKQITGKDVEVKEKKEIKPKKEKVEISDEKEKNESKE